MRIVHSQQEHSRQFFVAGILIPFFFLPSFMTPHPFIARICPSTFVPLICLSSNASGNPLFALFQVSITAICNITFSKPKHSPSRMPLHKTLVQCGTLICQFYELWPFPASLSTITAFVTLVSVSIASYQTINNRSKYSPSFACPWPFWHREGKKSLWFTFLPAKLPYHPACKESRV